MTQFGRKQIKPKQNVLGGHIWDIWSLFEKKAASDMESKIRGKHLFRETRSPQEHSQSKRQEI